ncbi:MAG: ABC transporter permease [Ruminococcaceae bacterium]|nr:ABC transporter permease [Oscillospiraceae bacterium]
MTKLLHADFRKCLKGVYFWAGIAESLLCGLFFGLCTRKSPYIDDVYVMPIFIIIASVISLFVGVEHSDGGIRNKLVSGHKKGNIYLSLLIVNIVFSLLSSMVFLGSFSFLQIGRTFVFPKYALVGSALGFILICLTYGIISTLISVLNPRKAIATVCCIIMVFATFAVCYAVEDILLRNEFIHIIEHNEDGTETEHLFNNPKYVGGIPRKILEFTEKAIPFGALKKYLFVISGCFNPLLVTLSLSEEKAVLLNILPLYSVGVSIFFSTLGYLAFGKKELK